MKVIDSQTAEILSLGEATLEEGKKIVEIAGRTCYKSLNLITEGSAEKFVNRMIESEHLSTLEHCTIYLKLPRSKRDDALFFSYNKYSETNSDGNYCYVPTNYRVIIENEMEDVLKYQCAYEPINHIRRITVRMVTNLQILGEFTRHRTMSFSVESSRYCNYSKDKFGNDLTFIKPNFGIYLKNKEALKNWEKTMEQAEYNYLKLAKIGANAQECAQALPKATKVEMVVTANVNEWKHFFDLRLFERTNKAHPQIKQLSIIIYKEFNKYGIKYNETYTE